MRLTESLMFLETCPSILSELQTGVSKLRILREGAARMKDVNCNSHMVLEDLDVGLASAEDIEGILDVQEENQPEQGGSLSARFTPEWFKQAINSKSLIVARSAKSVIGYVAFTSREAQAHVPIIQAMLKVCSNPGAYLHGPICVAQEFRGRGIASAMFRAQRVYMQQAPVMSFIREDNHSSRKAHIAMGLQEVTMFELCGVRYVVVAG